MNTSERALEDEEARLAAASLAMGDPTGWFDRLYAAGAAGRVPLPWSRREPHPLLSEWAQRHQLSGEGKRAIVPGCGLGADAEYLAGLGFTTTAFDISPTAIRLARHRHPDSPVEYVTADLLHLPRPWLRAFDLVAEIITVQALPRAVRHRATTSVARLTAPGGTLLVIAAVRDSTAEPQAGAPWPLTCAEIRQFAADGLIPAATEIATMPYASGERRWRAEFHADGNSARLLVGRSGGPVVRGVPG
jgi:SAM-dependent methyltransferase